MNPFTVLLGGWIGMLLGALEMGWARFLVFVAVTVLLHELAIAYEVRRRAER